MICIGYKIINGVRIYHYHLTKDRKEYLVINNGGDAPDRWGETITVMLWEPNQFVPAEGFTRLDLKYIKYDFKTTRKTERELLNNDEDRFFKHVYPKAIGVWTGEEINKVLDSFNEFDIIYNEGGTITEEMANKYPEVLTELIGYQVSVDVDGDHRNDGQMVDYTFDFVSPIGQTSSFTTEMCLMVGWNHGKSVTIR